MMHRLILMIRNLCNITRQNNLCLLYSDVAEINSSSLAYTELDWHCGIPRWPQVPPTPELALPTPPTSMTGCRSNINLCACALSDDVNNAALQYSGRRTLGWSMRGSAQRGDRTTRHNVKRAALRVRDPTRPDPLSTAVGPAKWPAGSSSSTAAAKFQDTSHQRRRSYGLGIFTHQKICRRGQSMFWPPKCHILSFETVGGISLQVPRHRRRKTCVKNGR